jgi:hypothetical protein
MIRHALKNIVNVELDVGNVVNDVDMRLKQRRKRQLDAKVPITTSNDMTRPVAKSVVSGQLGVGYVIDQVRHGRNASIGGQYVFWP